MQNYLIARNLKSKNFCHKKIELYFKIYYIQKYLKQGLTINSSLHRDARQLKLDKEEEMKLEWLQKNINDTSNMPEFEWYSTENWILRNYYLQMTLWSQGKCSF